MRLNLFRNVCPIFLFILLSSQSILAFDTTKPSVLNTMPQKNIAQDDSSIITEIVLGVLNLASELT